MEFQIDILFLFMMATMLIGSPFIFVEKEHKGFAFDFVWYFMKSHYLINYRIRFCVRAFMNIYD